MATTIRERYRSAVQSHCLTVDERTVFSDTDVLGAMGLADRNLARGYETDARGRATRTFTPAPLAVPLERLFAGDSRAAGVIVEILAGMAAHEARRQSVRITDAQATDISRAVLAWHRSGTCQPCGGRGKPIIKDTPVESARDCDHCAGTGKIPFETNFRHEWKPIARWLRDRVEIESGRAAPAAMRKIRAAMDF